MWNEVITFINRLPDHSWNFIFSNWLGNYNRGEERNLLGFTFYWREIWHFLGGAALGLSSLLFSLAMPKCLAVLLIVSAVFIGMGYKEFFLDAKEQKLGWDFKNVVDTLAWTLGAAAMGVGICKGL